MMYVQYAEYAECAYLDACGLCTPPAQKQSHARQPEEEYWSRAIVINMPVVNFASIIDLGWKHVKM